MRHVGLLLLLGLMARPAVSVAAEIQEGEYVLAQGKGTLVIGPMVNDQRTFKINTMGMNAHTCELEGQLQNGVATLPTNDGSPPCVVQFSANDEGISVKDNEAESCRLFCGVRAWFDGNYEKAMPECKYEHIKAERARFKKLYDQKSYKLARDVLQPVLNDCKRYIDEIDLGWMLNDLAVAHHKLNDDAACRRVLESIADRVSETSDAEPVLNELRAQIARATKYNLNRCRTKRQRRR